ncbi:hypothetical protein [Streptomyces sp. NPDC051554]|uniref:hypothetical protein n=1 Tax=Streptomyces sp. NPDC051554 TaxID=3365656 RepID=UPI0037B40920
MHGEETPGWRLALTERLLAAQDCSERLAEENRQLAEENRRLRLSRSRTLERLKAQGPQRPAAAT